MQSWRQALTPAVVLMIMMLLLLLPHGTYAQGMPAGGLVSTREIPDQKALESLVSTNRGIRMAAAAELDKARRQLVRELMAILGGTNSDRVKVAAAIVLGEYRASEAVPILVRHLEWDQAAPREAGGVMRHETKEELEETGWPVTQALVKIGMPAIPALLDRVTNTEDAGTTARCIWICQLIEGPEVTQFRLRGLLEKESDQKKKERIRSALEALARPKPGE
jgi:HEAT repeat protein